MLIDTTITFIGSGAMGEAMIKGIIAQHLIQPRDIVAADPLPERVQELRGRYGVRGMTDNVAAAREEGVLISAVGPRAVRLVTHLGVSAADAERAAGVLARL